MAFIYLVQNAVALSSVQKYAGELRLDNDAFTQMVYVL